MQAVLALVLTLVLIASVLVACGSEPASLTSPDAPAESGCEHFVNVVIDHGNGVLTQAEILVKYREVYDDLKLSEVPGLGDKAAALRREMAQNPSVDSSRISILLKDCRKVLENS